MENRVSRSERKAITLLLTMLLTIGIIGIFAPLSSAQAGTVLAVEQSLSLATAQGQIFDVNVTIADVEASSRLIGVQFRLGYDAGLVTVLDVVEGSFLSSFPHVVDPPYTFFMSFDEPGDPLYGDHVVVGNLLLPNATGDYPGPFPEGGGTLATITFNVTGATGSFDFELFDTMLIDQDGLEIPHELAYNQFIREFNVTVTDRPDSSYNRTSVAPMKFTIKYGDDSYYTYNDFGSITVGIHNGTHIIEQINLAATDFDASSNKWTARWIIPPNTPMLDNYTFVIAANNVIDQYGDTGPFNDIVSESFAVSDLPPLPSKSLNIEVDAGDIYFTGEQAEFFLLTTLDGIPVDITTIAAVMYKPEMSQLPLPTTQIATGLYKVTYNIAAADQPGTYALVVQASYTKQGTTTYGSSLDTFQISSTLTEWNATITEINGTLATIQTTMGQIQVDLGTINATLVDIVIDDYLAVIDSAVGQIQIDLDDINAEIVAIEGDVVTMNTSLGQISTTLDEIQESVGGVHSTANTTLYAASILSALAVIIGIAILMLLRKK